MNRTGVVRAFTWLRLVLVMGLSACMPMGRWSAGGGAALPAAPARCYSDEEVLRIEMLRERGDSAAEVAARVGGTAVDVRQLERRQRALALRKVANGAESIAERAQRLCAETPPPAESSPAGLSQAP